jgi:hypothetical protein
MWIRSGVHDRRVFWQRQHGKGWKIKAAMNGIGALATGITFIIVGTNKFSEGAWIALLLIPLLVTFFLRTHTRQKA